MRLQRSQAFGGDAAGELGHAAQPGQVEIGGNVRERIQNEVALHYPGMRQCQQRLRALLTRVAKEIEIDDSRSPTLAPCRPAERGLERAQRGEQRRGLQLREHARDRVDEVRLRACSRSWS